MPSSTPHQKFRFYHLPTRGRAWIKLGDAWYVSNVSIIFDCSMLCYLLFWAILGFIIHFYIIFRTNLLTGDPAQNCCFLPISVFRRKGISNGVEINWRSYFCKESYRMDLDPTSGAKGGAHEGGGRPLGRAPCLVPSSLLSWRGLQVSRVAFLPEITSPEGFIPFRLRLIFLFFETLK